MTISELPTCLPFPSKYICYFEDIMSSYEFPISLQI